MKMFLNIVVIPCVLFFTVMGVMFYSITSTASSAEVESNSVAPSVATIKEPCVLQDVTINDGNYYYNGKPVFLDEDCSTLLWQILDSNISYVVPIATYVEYADNIAIMHLD